MIPVGYIIFNQNMWMIKKLSRQFAFQDFSRLKYMYIIQDLLRSCQVGNRTQSISRLPHCGSPHQKSCRYDIFLENCLCLFRDLIWYFGLRFVQAVYDLPFWTAVIVVTFNCGCWFLEANIVETGKRSPTYVLDGVIRD